MAMHDGDTTLFPKEISCVHQISDWCPVQENKYKLYGWRISMVIWFEISEQRDDIRSHQLGHETHHEKKNLLFTLLRELSIFTRGGGDL